MVKILKYDNPDHKTKLKIRQIQVLGKRTGQSNNTGHSQHHFITQYITLRCTAVNEFYRMIGMRVAGHVRGNRTETDE